MRGGLVAFNFDEILILEIKLVYIYKLKEAKNFNKKDE